MADLKGREGRPQLPPPPPPRTSKFFQLHAVFWKFFAKSCVGAPSPPTTHPWNPTSGKSWIRHIHTRYSRPTDRILLFRMYGVYRPCSNKTVVAKYIKGHLCELPSYFNSIHFFGSPSKNWNVEHFLARWVDFFLKLINSNSTIRKSVFTYSS